MRKAVVIATKKKELFFQAEQNEETEMEAIQAAASRSEADTKATASEYQTRTFDTKDTYLYVERDLR